MSEDYYLVCKPKKLYMPLFTMGLGGAGLVSKNWLFDFILEVGREPTDLLHEDDLFKLSPDGQTLEEAGWTFINAWNRHEDDKRSN